MNALVNRIGLSSKLLLGYAGVLIFMMGEGLEQGWLSPYLISKGLTVQESALLFSVYGFSAAIAAWLSGVLAEIYTARRVMIVGLLMFLAGSLVFLGWGLPSNKLEIMIPTYALRGFGYPLFAYGFLVNELRDISDAQPGDKCIMDALCPAISAFGSAVGRGESFYCALEKLKLAAAGGRDSTRDMVAKIGRASRLGERSRGVLDAGAVSCCLLLTQLAESVQLQLTPIEA